MVETDTDNWKLMSLRKRPALPKPVNKIINDVNNSSINAGSNPALTIFKLISWCKWRMEWSETNKLLVATSGETSPHSSGTKSMLVTQFKF